MPLWLMRGFWVAPHAGAWIETDRQDRQPPTHPLVAPHAGAWIETYLHLLFSVLAPVAPHAGAWIET